MACTPNELNTFTRFDAGMLKNSSFLCGASKSKLPIGNGGLNCVEKHCLALLWNGIVPCLYMSAP